MIVVVGSNCMCELLELKWLYLVCQLRVQQVISVTVIACRELHLIELVFNHDLAAEEIV